ncbi:hypothetical protein C4K38_3248 [Pseudomonas chlororaphis subsp. piscium]|nr:hypothetical protein C4K38_3248 [Pseudomonas chlororaphis subsp. piscium]
MTAAVRVEKSRKGISHDSAGFPAAGQKSAAARRMRDVRVLRRYFLEASMRGRHECFMILAANTGNAPVAESHSCLSSAAAQASHPDSSVLPGKK